MNGQKTMHRKTSRAAKAIVGASLLLLGDSRRHPEHRRRRQYASLCGLWPFTKSARRSLLRFWNLCCSRTGWRLPSVVLLMIVAIRILCFWRGVGTSIYGWLAWLSAGRIRRFRANAVQRRTQIQVNLESDSGSSSLRSVPEAVACVRPAAKSLQATRDTVSRSSPALWGNCVGLGEVTGKVFVRQPKWHHLSPPVTPRAGRLVGERAHAARRADVVSCGVAQRCAPKRRPLTRPPRLSLCGLFITPPTCIHRFALHAPVRPQGAPTRRALTRSACSG